MSAVLARTRARSRRRTTLDLRRVRPRAGAGVRRAPHETGARARGARDRGSAGDRGRDTHAACRPWLLEHGADLRAAVRHAASLRRRLPIRRMGARLSDPHGRVDRRTRAAVGGALRGGRCRRAATVGRVAGQVPRPWIGHPDAHRAGRPAHAAAAGDPAAVRARAHPGDHARRPRDRAAAPRRRRGLVAAISRGAPRGHLARRQRAARRPSARRTVSRAGDRAAAFLEGGRCRDADALATADRVARLGSRVRDLSARAGDSDGHTGNSGDTVGATSALDARRQPRAARGGSERVRRGTASLEFGQHTGWTPVQSPRAGRSRLGRACRRRARRRARGRRRAAHQPHVVARGNRAHATAVDAVDRGRGGAASAVRAG